MLVAMLVRCDVEIRPTWRLSVRDGYQVIKLHKSHHIIISYHIVDCISHYAAGVVEVLFPEYFLGWRWLQKLFRFVQNLPCFLGVKNQDSICMRLVFLHMKELQVWIFVSGKSSTLCHSIILNLHAVSSVGHALFSRQASPGPCTPSTRTSVPFPCQGSCHEAGWWIFEYGTVFLLKDVGNCWVNLRKKLTSIEGPRALTFHMSFETLRDECPSMVEKKKLFKVYEEHQRWWSFVRFFDLCSKFPFVPLEVSSFKERTASFCLSHGNCWIVGIDPVQSNPASCEWFLFFLRGNSHPICFCAKPKWAWMFGITL